MSRNRQPLPRYAIGMIDEAVMELAKALYECEELRQGKRVIFADIKLTGADCIIYINRAIEKLKQIQVEVKQDSRNGVQTDSPSDH